jgi:hypothetical protein
VSQAIYLLANRDESYQFKTGAEVLKVGRAGPGLPEPCALSLGTHPRQS